MDTDGLIKVTATILLMVVIITLMTWEVGNIDQPLQEQLILHEGLRLEPYKCTADKWTIGVGRNLEDRGITQTELINFLKREGITKDTAMRWLENDLRRIKHQLADYKWYRSLSDNRRNVLVDMCFNLGLRGLLSFQRMIQAIKSQNFDIAAEEMLDSRWSEQVGKRAERLAEMMREDKSFKEVE